MDLIDFADYTSDGSLGGRQVITSLQFSLWKIRAWTALGLFSIAKVGTAFNEPRARQVRGDRKTRSWLREGVAPVHPGEGAHGHQGLSSTREAAYVRRSRLASGYLRTTATNPSSMRLIATLAACLPVFASFAQQATWNVSAQFRNPLWSDERVIGSNTPMYSTYVPYEDLKRSIALGGGVERQFANGCAVRIGFEHARNAMDRQSLQTGASPGWMTTITDTDHRFRQETNTFTIGATHYLAFGRLEPCFGGEAVVRAMDDLKENIVTTEHDKQSGALVYAAAERVRYSGGTTYGFAPLLGFRYRILCELYLGAEFAPTWTWGDFGATRSSVSVQEYPDQYTYVNTTTYGGTSGGPYFLPRFGVGLSYRFMSKNNDASVAAPEPLVVPVK